jgi:hypoxanthine phosphoribosyltransferase
MTINVHDLTFEKWISQADIELAIHRMAIEIRAQYENSDLLVIGVLNGAVFFTVDLLRELDLPYRLDFVQAASYKGTQSTGTVSTTPLKERIANSHVLLVEDIVDTGRTVQVIKSVIMDSKPASFRIASLFYKPEADLHNKPPDFIGFSIPNDFILGYGLDYDGLGRELRDVYRVTESEA